MEGWRPCFGTAIICHVQGVKRSQRVRVNMPTGSTRRPSTLRLHLIFSFITCDEPATTPRRRMGLGIEPPGNQSSQVALNRLQIFTAREIMTTQHPLIRGQHNYWNIQDFFESFAAVLDCFPHVIHHSHLCKRSSTCPPPCYFFYFRNFLRTLLTSATILVGTADNLWSNF